MKKWILKKGFIQLNLPSSGYIGIQRFSKAALLPMYGSVYPSYFGNPTWSEMMKWFVWFVTYEVIGKMNDNASNLPCFT